MIEHALQSPAWDPTVNRSYDLDDAVFWLLGLGTKINKIGQRPDFSGAFAGMDELFSRVAARWFKSPKLVSGFLYYVTQPALANLLAPAIVWFAAQIPLFDTYAWRDGFEDNLVAFLRTCWARERERISADPGLNKDFRDLLASVVARGGHIVLDGQTMR